MADGTETRASEPHYGPRGDYCAVYAMNRNESSIPAGMQQSNQGNLYYNPSYQNPNNSSWSEFPVGPFRACMLSTPGPLDTAGGTPAAATQDSWKTWRPRDNMSWWYDGSSNQIIFGEKHLHKDHVGRCVVDNSIQEPGDNADNTKGRLCGDCSYLSMAPAYSSGAFLRSALYKYDANGDAWMSGRPPIMRPDEHLTTNALGRSFGSFHSGTSNFLLGDGSVRGFPVTTTLNVVAALANVKDGKTVSLP